ncbi:MAG: hypothetical protein MHMPM18_002136 [Marteilia pararefringens]
MRSIAIFIQALIALLLPLSLQIYLPDEDQECMEILKRQMIEENKMAADNFLQCFQDNSSDYMQCYDAHISPQIKKMRSEGTDSAQSEFLSFYSGLLSCESDNPILYSSCIDIWRSLAHDVGC